MNLSVIIPVYNSEKTIYHLVNKLHQDLQNINFETILINDFSSDNSYNECLKITKKHKNITFIDLEKNYGEFTAVLCGLNHAKGLYSVLIDDDFQNPPSEIIKLYETAVNDNFDVVYSKYTLKKHHWFRNLGSIATNLIASFTLKKPIDLYLSSFKIIKSNIVKKIIDSDIPNRYIDGIILNSTQNIGSKEIIHSNREIGESGYTMKKLFNVFLSTLFGYSRFPLRTFVLMLIIGFVIFGINLILNYLNINSLFAMIFNWILYFTICISALIYYIFSRNQKKHIPYRIKQLISS